MGGVRRVKMSAKKGKPHPDEGKLGQSAHDGRPIGINVPGQICGLPELSASVKLVFGLVAQLAKKPGHCYASNGFMATACGLNRDTVSACVTKLERLGLIRVTTAGGRRRIYPLDSGSIRQPASAAVSEGSQDSAGDVRNIAEPPAEKRRGHLKEGVKSQRDIEEEEGSCSSSSNFSSSERAGCVELATSAQQLGRGCTLASGVDFAAAAAVAKDWAAQVCSLLRKRDWVRRLDDSTEKCVRLEVPAVGNPSRSQLDQLVALALDIWPGSDPVMALRQLLRAGAWTSERRDKLQQYAHLAESGTLSVRALLKLGGREDPLAYALTAAGAVPPPPPRVRPGTAAETDVMRRLGYDDKRSWREDVWTPSWAEAAGRCLTYDGAPPQVYQAATFSVCEALGHEVPMPWISDSMAPGCLMAFAGLYAKDRMSAWSGGNQRMDVNYPMQQEMCYEGCVGRDLADAVAQGQRPMAQRSCLLCAAMELRLLPALVRFVSWSGTAEELAARLEELAAQTDQDAPPIRGSACGKKDCGASSYLRCPFANAEYVHEVRSPRATPDGGSSAGSGGVEQNGAVSHDLSREELLAKIARLRDQDQITPHTGNRQQNPEEVNHE